MAYPVTIHCTASGGMWSSRSMEGRATFTMLKSRTTMNAATRIRASWRGGRAGAGAWAWAGALAATGWVLAATGWGCGRLGGAVTGMIPIKYVTDRFGFPEG